MFFYCLSRFLEWAPLFKHDVSWLFCVITCIKCTCLCQQCYINKQQRCKCLSIKLFYCIRAVFITISIPFTISPMYVFSQRKRTIICGYVNPDHLTPGKSKYPSPSEFQLERYSSTRPLYNNSLVLVVINIWAHKLFWMISHFISHATSWWVGVVGIFCVRLSQLHLNRWTEFHNIF